MRKTFILLMLVVLAIGLIAATCRPCDKDGCCIRTDIENKKMEMVCPEEPTPQVSVPEEDKGCRECDCKRRQKWAERLDEQGKNIPPHLVKYLEIDCEEKKDNQLCDSEFREPYGVPSFCTTTT